MLLSFYPLSMGNYSIIKQTSASRMTYLKINLKYQILQIILSKIELEPLHIAQLMTDWDLTLTSVVTHQDLETGVKCSLFCHHLCHNTHVPDH